MVHMEGCYLSTLERMEGERRRRDAAIVDVVQRLMEEVRELRGR